MAHVVRINTVGYAETLLDAIIDEGVACFIEQSVTGNREIPYIQKMKSEQSLLKEAKKLFSKRLSTELHNTWFFGKGRLPEWIGYRLGYLIVKEFMNTHKMSLDELVRTKTKDIIR